MYKKIDFLNSRIIEKDEQFFKSIGIVDSKKIGKIEIKAINGIFGFVNMRDNEQNFELIKLMAEDGSIDEIIKSDMTSKNYYLHNITFQTSEKITQKEVIDPLLKYFQDNSFYADDLFGEFKYIENGVEMANTLNNLNNNYLILLIKKDLFGFIKKLC